jgi:hypothetical protein
VEAFEQFVAVALEADGFIVSPAIKFDVSRPTKKAAYAEVQRHGYEVDLVAARSDRLVLATVKSFFGSQGVTAEGVLGTAWSDRGRKLYVLLNDRSIRSGVIRAACKRYGYAPAQVRLRLYVGRFAGPKTGSHEKRIRGWCATQHAGGGPIEVFGLHDVVGRVREAAASRQYRDNPVLVTMKVLQAAGLLKVALPEIS